MEKILLFLFEHLELCVACVVALITLLLQLIRKKPVKIVDCLKQIILVNLPDFINQAEASFQKGFDKYNYVIYLVEELFKINGFEFTPYYRKFVEEQIEHILSTPQKKGD